MYMYVKRGWMEKGKIQLSRQNRRNIDKTREARKGVCMPSFTRHPHPCFICHPHMTIAVVSPSGTTNHCLPFSINHTPPLSSFPCHSHPNIAFVTPPPIQHNCLSFPVIHTLSLPSIDGRPALLHPCLTFHTIPNLQLPAFLRHSHYFLSTHSSLNTFLSLLYTYSDRFNTRECALALSKTCFFMTTCYTKRYINVLLIDNAAVILFAEADNSSISSGRHSTCARYRRHCCQQSRTLSQNRVLAQTM
jgi:hypothetical protein